MKYTRKRQATLSWTIEDESSKDQDARAAQENKYGPLTADLLLENPRDFFPEKHRSYRLVPFKYWNTQPNEVIFYKKKKKPYH